MNREDLIVQIEEIIPIVNKWIEYDNLRKKKRDNIKSLEGGIADAKPNIGNLIKNAWMCLVACFLLGGVFLLPIEWFTDIKITLPFYLIYTVILTIILTVIVRIRDTKSYEEMKKNLPRLKEEYVELEASFNREVVSNLPQIYNIFPKTYAYPQIIKTLYSYLVDCRADSLKEAINLYELEKQQKEQMRMLEAYDKQIADMQRTQNQLEQRVADAEAQANYAYIKSMYENH